MKTYRGGFVLVLTLALAVLGKTADARVERVGDAIRSGLESKRQMLHVLAVGSDYSSSTSPITGAADAQALASVFKTAAGSLYGAAGVVEVVNDAASRNGILQAVKPRRRLPGTQGHLCILFRRSRVGDGGTDLLGAARRRV